MHKILIAGSDTALRQSFSDLLVSQGYITVQADMLKQALTLLHTGNYDLLIADMDMPGSEGYELVDALHTSGENTAVLCVSERGEYESMSRAYKCGADDYMTKPVNKNVMLLRVSALLRRTQKVKQHRLSIGQTTLVLETMRVYHGEKVLNLPQKEFMLLYKMASNPEKVYSRQDLMGEIWGYIPENTSHTVDVHIGRLRERIKDIDDFRIITSRGRGYKLSKKR